MTHLKQQTHSKHGRMARGRTSVNGLEGLERRVLLSGTWAEESDSTSTPHLPGVCGCGGCRSLVVGIVGHSQQFGPVPSSPTASLASLPRLASRPGAPATLFLDFDGAAAMRWGTFDAPWTDAYDTDGDPSTFNATEVRNIEEIWGRVAEAFSPFELNVTTLDPGTLVRRQSARVIFGGTGAWMGDSYGGVAYLGGFHNASDPNAFVFTKNLGNGAPKATADAAIHEAGHLFGLRHQSSWNGGSLVAEYDPGTASLAPYMGLSYYATRGAWRTGTTTSASTSQDDLAVLAGSSNGFGYRADDAGDTTETAAEFEWVRSGEVRTSGVIERTGDWDVYRFTVPASEVRFTVSPAPHGAMLDVSARLLDADGATITSAQTPALTETLSAAVQAGTYYLAVGGAGQYGDLGQYTVAGVISSGPAQTTPPDDVFADGSAIGGAVVVTWSDRSDNETGFVVERSETDVTWADAGTVGENVGRFVDTGGVGGLRVDGVYRYRVRAIGVNGLRTAASNPASAGVRPATPRVLGVTATSHDRVRLAWADVLGERGYVVERSGGGRSWATVATPAADVTAADDTPVAPGTTYHYRLRSVGAHGQSPASDPIAVQTPTLNLPATPRDVAALATGDTTVRLRWTPSAGATGYAVERRAGTRWVRVVPDVAGGSTSQTVVEGLTPATTHTLRVRAVNAAGWSDASRGVTARTAPSAPTGVVARAIDHASMRLTWRDVVGETGYRVERRVANDRTWRPVTTLRADTTSFWESGLSPNVRYEYRVTAFDDGGLGSVSNVAGRTTPLPAPTNFRGRAGGSSVTLSWDDSRGETGYVVESWDGRAWSALGRPLSADVTSLVVHNRPPGSTTAFRLRAMNHGGASAPSGEARVTLPPGTPSVMIRSAATTSVTLRWSDVVGERGYRVELSANGGATWQRVAQPPADVLTHTAGGLSPGMTYAFRVRAFNDAGSGGWSPTLRATTLRPATPSRGPTFSA